MVLKQVGLPRRKVSQMETVVFASFCLPRGILLLFSQFNQIADSSRRFPSSILHYHLALHLAKNMFGSRVFKLAWSYYCEQPTLLQRVTLQNREPLKRGISLGQPTHNSSGFAFSRHGNEPNSVCQETSRECRQLASGTHSVSSACLLAGHSWALS
jgi:hypothetical protein